MLTATAIKSFRIFLALRGQENFQPIQLTMTTMSLLTLNYSTTSFTLCSPYQKKHQQLNYPVHLGYMTFTLILTFLIDLLTTLDTSKACDIDNFSPKYSALSLIKVISHLLCTIISCCTIHHD